jgi:cyanophycinase
MSPSRPREGHARGWIVPIGGAEDKVGDEEILKRFVRLCGGRSARIAVIPTASELRGTGRRYEELFRDLRADKVWVLPFETRAQCQDEEELGVLAKANGVFLTGGNQLRISTILGGTDVARAIRSANARGVAIGGTSAGAAVLSEHMIAFGKSGSTPRAGMVSLAPGLGLTNRVVIDQHFRQRDRIGRLLAALAYNPFAVGIGLDEDTAAFIDGDDEIEVLGSGAITIVDASKLEHSSMGSASDGDSICITGIKLHILNGGSRFNLHTRTATPPPGTLD